MKKFGTRVRFSCHGCGVVRQGRSYVAAEGRLPTRVHPPKGWFVHGYKDTIVYTCHACIQRLEDQRVV